MMFLQSNKKRQLPARILHAGLAMLCLSACATIDSIRFTPTPIFPTPTLTPTATIVWFPPSVTPSPEYSLTRAPTPDMRPQKEEIIFQDGFSNGLWNIASSNEGGATLYEGRLNLAAQGGVYVFRTREGTTLGDFYMEVSAEPSLCKDADAYGVLIRANAKAYYRFSLTCNGTVSAEKVSGDAREVLQKPIATGDAPLGAGHVRIGVTASGTQMRLFLNERYQFSIENPTYRSGAPGIFVRAAGTTPVVVSFSDLVTYGIR